MGKCLQRIEPRKQSYFHIGHLATHSVGKAIKQRIARSKGYNIALTLIASKHIIDWHGYVNPLRTLRQQVSHNLVMTFATSENPAVGHYLQNIERQKQLPVIAYTYYSKQFESF
jgi:hypothetical protein